MALNGNSFIFNGISSEMFELEMYSIGDNHSDDVEFANTVSIVEASVGNKWRPLFYGVKFDKKLTFDMVFGVDSQRIDQHKYLDNFELESISSWLAGHETYHWLEIQREDLAHIRFHCIVTELSPISYDGLTYALKATFTCDGPYAYTYPYEYTYSVDGELSIVIDNISSHNGYYYPELEIEMLSTGDISITNCSDNNRSLCFTAIEDDNVHLHINCETGVITSSSLHNPYSHFNFNFIRLKRGINELLISGSCNLVMRCIYPVAVGG